MLVINLDIIIVVITHVDQGTKDQLVLSDQILWSEVKCVLSAVNACKGDGDDDDDRGGCEVRSLKW